MGLRTIGGREAQKKKEKKKKNAKRGCWMKSPHSIRNKRGRIRVFLQARFATRARERKGGGRQKAKKGGGKRGDRMGSKESNALKGKKQDGADRRVGSYSKLFLVRRNWGGPIAVSGVQTKGKGTV